MWVDKMCRLYEGSAVRQVTGDSIRPGGFQLTDRALEICAPAPGAAILDVGCGTGATVEYLIEKYNYKAVGIDPSEVLLAQGRQRRPDLPISQARGEDLPFKGGEMDCVFAECTLSVTEHPDAVLKECHRVLKDKGHLVVSDLYIKNRELTAELRKLPLASCITGATTRNELEKKLGKAGFKLIFWEDHTDLLKQLVFKIIMSYGSMNNFWQQAGAESFDCCCVQGIIKRARPGYFLLVAQKQWERS
ncbi:DVU_1556 family methyltransferase [Desulfofalx alkaliphila]|uniref:DVU_1556 family methyltransferase n=1 Tax=Desulfofalx alkaliphila TaxID=105483 RepID=UPI0004E0C561|nr:class I SAM-dependent methyltransferase [Desulfofalx alkaliphila]